jgi:hypothetical protein
MYTCYKGRSHTKKQRNTCKPKINAAERKKRKKLKQLNAIFPNIKFNLCLPAMKKNANSERRMANSQNTFNLQPSTFNL